MQKSNLVKKLLVVANIIVGIFLILIIIFHNKFTYSLYWISIPLLIFFIILFIYEVDKGLMEIDQHEAKAIRKTYNDVTVVATVFYGVLYLIIEFVDMINSTVRDNIYLVSGFFIMTLLYELFIFTAIGNAKKDTSELLNKRK